MIAYYGIAYGGQTFVGHVAVRDREDRAMTTFVAVFNDSVSLRRSGGQNSGLLAHLPCVENVAHELLACSVQALPVRPIRSVGYLAP